VVVFQCPKSFLPDRENLRNLRSFFRSIERRGRTLAWEPRGEDWRADLVRGICEEHGLVHCVDPFEARPAHRERLYWRLHGKTGYRYRYTAEDLEELRAMVRLEATVPGPHYVMFNNIYSREDAQRFVGLAGERSAP
jgi:uncharacterized protein YecE (DUF72 family)